MIRLALLQTDSSHAEVYQDLAVPEVGVRVAHLWGADAGRTAAVARDGVRVCADLEQAIADVDGIMICGRWGDGHRAVAEAALQAEVPVYVDKPFTNSAADADHLLALYRDAGVPLFSASPLRFAAEVEEAAAALDGLEVFGGSVAGLGQWPDLGPKACEVYFYGIHVMELVTALFGIGIEAVTTHRGERLETALLRYPGGRQVALNLLMRGAERYEATVLTADGTRQIAADPAGDFYERTLARVRDFVRSGRPPIDEAETRQNIHVLAAIERARQDQGRWVAVPLGADEAS